MGLRSRTVDQQPEVVSPPRGTRTRLNREEQVARVAMSAADAERDAYIEELRRSVWDGSYNPSGEEIASALLTERLAERSGKL